MIHLITAFFTQVYDVEVWECIYWNFLFFTIPILIFWKPGQKQRINWFSARYERLAESFNKQKETVLHQIIEIRQLKKNNEELLDLNTSLSEWNKDMIKKSGNFMLQLGEALSDLERFKRVRGKNGQFKKSGKK